MTAWLRTISLKLFLETQYIVLQEDGDILTTFIATSTHSLASFFVVTIHHIQNHWTLFADSYVCLVRLTFNLLYTKQLTKSNRQPVIVSLSNEIQPILNYIFLWGEMTAEVIVKDEHWNV